jgi:HAMP domain-containing protein
MSQTFVVEVTEKPESTPEASVENLAKAFNISSRKIELMLKRLPGVATKPISQQEAAVVVTYFEQAGLKAIVKSVTVPSSVGSTSTTGTTSTSSLTFQNADATKTTSSDVARARLTSVTTPETKVQGEVKIQSEVKPKGEVKLRSEPRVQSTTSTLEIPMIQSPSIPDIVRESVPPPRVQPSVQPPVASAAAPIQPLDVAELLSTLRSAPPQTQTAVLPTKSEDRPEHDILRTTLIGEPDPRKTQIGSKTLSDVYKTSSTQLGSSKSAPSNKLSNRLLLSAILPTLLTLLGSLLVTYLMVQPALYKQFQGSSRNPAIAIASGLSSVLTKTPSGDIDYANLQRSIEATRTAFAEQDLHFIVATDSQGEVLPASWFASSSFMTNTDVRDSIQAQTANALTNHTLVSSFVPLESQSGLLGASQLEVVAQPLRFEEQIVGAIVVGITSETAQTNIWRVLGSVALLSLIPLALASLLAIFAIRPITKRVSYLTQRANDISRGNLADSIELKGNDELSELAEALERLRVSMQNALERLRRRR